jgi:asparagine synthase (glutamine-hydrolysing)
LFAALFNFDGGPLAVPPSVAGRSGGLQFKVLGAARQAALLHEKSELDGQTGEESAIEVLADRYWIVGRIRLDAREQLTSRLSSRLAAEGALVSDARLCLHAYAAWGERCVDHLAGDFAFVLWDDTRQCLFAVRDQLGKRVLFHARTGALGMIGDSLDWIARQGPGLGGVDDYWVADFLTLSWSREHHRTVYRDIHRLAPAHLLLWNAAGVQLRRYWQLDIPEPLYLGKRGAYAERFRELLSLAIADRLPSGKIGIAMSGGLDSTALAASAVSVASDPRRVVAYCEHYEDLMHIEEDRFASLAARHLGIELQIERFDDMVYDPDWQSRGIRSPEPTQEIVNAHCVRGLNQALSRRAAVWFEGEGPDNALAFDRDAYLSWLFRCRSWRRLGGALVDYAAVKGLSGWAETLRRHVVPVREQDDPPKLPPWLKPEFVDRLHLAERIRDLGEGGDASHPWHPGAMASFTSPIWQDYLGNYDLQESLAPLRWRHPYLDLRVLQFMLSVPPIPWGWRKHLVREAMRGRLPGAVLRRPKTPLAVMVRAEMLRRHGLPPLATPGGMAPYIERGRLPGPDASSSELTQAINVYVFDHWTRSDQANPPGEALYPHAYCG